MTGDVSNSDPTNSSWMNRTSSEQSAHTNQVQNMIDGHNDLHKEIDSLDINPKDAKKKVRIVIHK